MPPPQTIPNLGFENSAWNFSSQDKYLLVKASLSLYQIYHLWDISEGGDFTAISTQTTMPRNWQKPISLNSYLYRIHCIIMIYINRIVSDSR